MFLIQSLDLMIKISNILGLDQERSEYESEAAAAREEFHSEYFTANSRIVSDSAAAYALGICLNILRPEQRAHAADRLVYLVKKEQLQDRYRLRRYAIHLRSSSIDRTRAGSVCDVTGEELSVMAVHCVDGRYHHVGEMGQHDARRQSEPERDDILQSLRFWGRGKVHVREGGRPTTN